MKFDIGPSRQWGCRHTGWDLPNGRFNAPFLVILALFVLGGVAFPPTAWGDDSGSGPGYGNGYDDDDDDDQDKKHRPNKVKITEQKKLRFGSIASSFDGPGTATVTPDGTLSTSGYAIPMGGNPQAGKYKLKGKKNAWVLVTLPTSATLYSNWGTATLTNFVSDPPAGMVQLNNKGNLTLKLGATLTVPPGQPGGRYRGHFTIYADPQ